MFPKFLKYKRDELKGAFHLIVGKLTGNERKRLKGAEEAINALEKERESYLKEKLEAENKLEPDLDSYRAQHQNPGDKVIRETNNRDISPY